MKLQERLRGKQYTSACSLQFVNKGLSKPWPKILEHLHLETQISNCYRHIRELISSVHVHFAPHDLIACYSVPAWQRNCLLVCSQHPLLPRLCVQLATWHVYKLSPILWAARFLLLASLLLALQALG